MKVNIRLTHDNRDKKSTRIWVESDEPIFNNSGAPSKFDACNKIVTKVFPTVHQTSIDFFIQAMREGIGWTFPDAKCVLSDGR